MFHVLVCFVANGGTFFHILLQPMGICHKRFCYISKCCIDMEHITGEAFYCGGFDLQDLS
jgi:hypothetical protein